MTRVNYGKIFNDFFIANLLLSVVVKEFRRSVKIWQSYGKKIKWHPFFRTWCRMLLSDWTNMKISQTEEILEIRAF